MRDCDDITVQDRLPELLHGRLSGAERASVQAHVDGCAACGAEWRVLRASHAAIEAAAPRVNVEAIAAAVAARLAADRVPTLRVVRGDGRAQVVHAVRGRSTRGGGFWSSTPLRAAAAVVVMAVGAGVVVARRSDGPVSAPTTAPSAVRQPVAVAPGVPGSESVAVASPKASSATHAPASVDGASALGATFSDLSDDELAAVIRAVESDAGLPAADSSATPALVTSGEEL